MLTITDHYVYTKAKKQDDPDVPVFVKKPRSVLQTKPKFTPAEIMRLHKTQKNKKKQQTPNIRGKLSASNPVILLSDLKDTPTPQSTILPHANPPPPKTIERPESPIIDLYSDDENAEDDVQLTRKRKKDTDTQSIHQGEQINTSLIAEPPPIIKPKTIRLFGKDISAI